MSSIQITAVCQENGQDQRSGWSLQVGTIVACMKRMLTALHGRALVREIITACHLLDTKLQSVPHAALVENLQARNNLWQGCDSKHAMDELPPKEKKAERGPRA